MELESKHPTRAQLIEQYKKLLGEIAIPPAIKEGMENVQNLAKLSDDELADLVKRWESLSTRETNAEKSGAEMEEIIKNWTDEFRREMPGTVRDAVEAAVAEVIALRTRKD